VLASFTLEAFLALIARYNAAFWPLQIVAYALGIGAVVFATVRTRHSGWIVSGVLAVLWLWVGIVFDGITFPQVLPIAVAFAPLFVIQGLLFVLVGVRGRRLVFRPRADAYGVVGALLVLYGLVAYPAIEYGLGRGYPELLSFGLVPCPTAVFTLGLLLWCEKPPVVVLVLPVLYALSGVVPASIGIVEDVGLVIAGLVTGAMFVYRQRSQAWS
jgi:hypothetical protein